MFERLHVDIQYAVPLIFIVVYFGLLGLERLRPLRQQVRPLAGRLAVNFAFTLMVMATAGLLVGPLSAYTVYWTQSHQFGLLAWFPQNQFLLFVSGFLLMDLTFYYWHRLNHEIPLLWRFHNVHHVDPDLDVTTAMRFHFVEITYSSGFRLVQLGLIGVSPLSFVVYEFVFLISTFFHHSNVNLPIRLERMLNKLIVTPRMHGIHHSAYREETDRNYGVVFSFWDRLHRTLKLNIPQQKITIGVPAYLNKTDNTVLNLLTMPVKTQRRYWRRGDAKFIDRNLGETALQHLSE